MSRGIVASALILAGGLLLQPGAGSAQEGLSSLLVKLERMEARLQAIETTREAEVTRLEERLARAPQPNGELDVKRVLAAIEPRIAGLEGEVQIQREAAGDSTEALALAEMSGELRRLMEEVRALALAVEARNVIPAEDVPEESNGPENGHGASVAEETVELPRSFDSPVWGLSGFAHIQLNTSSSEDGLGSGFRIRRARLTVSGSFNQYLSGKIEPDFGEGVVSLKDAYVKLSSYEGSLNFTVGQFKQPFDIFELTSDTKLQIIERAGDINGVGGCPGVGGLCSYGRFTGKLGYAGRDLGVKVDGSADDGRIAYSASLTNGEGENKAETNNTKTMAGRLTYRMANGIRFSGNLSLKDYSTETDPARARAYGFDVEAGSLGKPGFHTQVAFSAGDNWKNLDEAGAPVGFRAAQALAGYRIPVRRYPGLLDSVEPVARVSWGDPSQNLRGDGGMLLTPGVMFHLAGGNYIATNLDVWNPETGNAEWSFKIQTYLTIAGIASR